MAIDCNRILKDGVFTTLNYEASEISQESLRTWFFSDKFESRYRDSDTSASITIPLEGIPVTFGGSHASSDAWEKREIQENSTLWDFSNLTWQKVLLQEEATEVIRAWTACVTRDNQNPERLILEAEELNDVVTLSIRHQFVLGAPIPIVLGFGVSPGLDAMQATEDLTFTEIAEGQNFQFSWVGDADAASITVRTTIGGKSITVNRPARGIAIVTYDVPEGEAWDYLETRRSQAITTDNRHNEDADGRQPTSPDGRWWASDKSVEMSVSPNEKIGDASAQYAGGRSGWEWTTLDYLNDRRTVRLYLRGWGYPVSYVIVAPILRRRVPLVPKSATFEVRVGILEVDVPVNFQNGRLRVTVGSAAFDVSLGQETEGLTLEDRSEVGANVRFRYSVRVPQLPHSDISFLRPFIAEADRNDVESSLAEGRNKAFKLEGTSSITYL